MHNPNGSFAKKVFAAGLAVTTALWAFGGVFVFVAQAQSVEAHPAGTLVLSGGTVWHIADDGSGRHGIDSMAKFNSHRFDFADVVPANSSDLALPDLGLMPLGSGVLFNDGGTVYQVAGGMKHGFTSAANFTGNGFSFANVVNGNLSGVPSGALIDNTSSAHLEGTFVNSGGTVWMITATGRQGVPSPGVLFSYGAGFGDIVTANAADLALANEGNATFRTGTLVNDGGTIWAVTSTTKRGFPSASNYTGFGFNFSMPVAGSTAGLTAGANFGGGTTPPPTTPPTTPPASSTGTLTASLASDTPAAGIAIKSAIRVPFTKVNLTATGGDVIVDSWVVERTGVAQDSTFSGLDIIDLSTNAAINESEKTLSSNHTANFTEDLTIANGTTKSVMISGNMSTGGAGEQPKLALNSITLKGGSVVGSFPIVGNAMTVNTTITIGTATVQRGAYVNASSTTLEVGKTDYDFLSFQVEAGSGEDITFGQVKVYQLGSASLSNDMENFKLYRDGTFLADGTADGNYVNFNFTPELLPKGQTNQYRVKADVVDGSARTIKLSIRNINDLLVTGQTYGANIKPTYSGTSGVASTPVLTNNEFTISVGTVRVGRSNTVAAGNIAVGNDQTLGAFEFEIKGEPAIVTALTLTVASSSTATVDKEAVKSFRLVDSNGTTVAGPTDRDAGPLTVKWTDTFTVPVGTSHYNVVANLATNGKWANNDTITVSFTPSSAVTVKGETTGQTITASPSSSISASTQTVKAANLTVTKNSTPTDKTVITDATQQLIGSWNFDATDSGEDVRVTSIAIRASTTSKLNNLTLNADGAALSPVNDNPATSNDATATSTFGLSPSLVVTKGTSTKIDLYADIGSDAVAGEVDAWGLTSTNSAANNSVVAYGVQTGNRATVTLTASDGALMTIAAAGTLTVDLHADNPPQRQSTFGSTGTVLSAVRLKATNEDVYITKMTLRVADGDLTGTADGNFEDVDKIHLKLDGAVIGDTNGYNVSAATRTLNFDVNDVYIEEGVSGEKLEILGDLVQIGTNQPGTANADIKVGLNGANGFTATGASNNSATITYNDSTGSAIVLHKGVPSVVIETPAGSLSASATLHRAKISAVGGTVGIFRMSYVTTTSTGLKLTNLLTKLAACNGGCGSIAVGSQLTTTDADGDYLVDASETWDLQVANTLAHGKRYLAISAGSTATIDLTGTVTGFTANSDSVQTSLLGDTATSTNDTGGDPTAAFTANTNEQGNFVWSDVNSDDTQAASSLTNKQWYNGYLVSGLGTTATTSAVTMAD